MVPDGWQGQYSRLYILTCSSQNSVADFKKTEAGDSSGCYCVRTVCMWEEMILQKIQSYQLQVIILLN